MTAEIETRLRAVTLNYATVDDATRAVRLASLIAALFERRADDRRRRPRLGAETAIARRIEELSTRLPFADAALRAQADQLVRRLDAVQRVAAKHGVLIEDVGITLELSTRTAVRRARRLVACRRRTCRAVGSHQSLAAVPRARD